MLFVIEKDFMAISQLMREIKKIFSLLWVCILILHMKEKANNTTYAASNNLQLNVRRRKLPFQLSVQKSSIKLGQYIFHRNYYCYIYKSF